ncbi:unnamed protein product [Toxocara canis]|uniref:GSDH domain-containing protein n=1 Tax=Toxocara canis TaxID=6265 RepID=A0A183U4Z0_TOXCA|nr:unnamed protein product [Toxocara canis]
MSRYLAVVFYLAAVLPSFYFQNEQATIHEMPEIIFPMKNQGVRARNSGNTLVLQGDGRAIGIVNSKHGFENWRTNNELQQRKHVEIFTRPQEHLFAADPHPFVTHSMSMAPLHTKRFSIFVVSEC